MKLTKQITPFLFFTVLSVFATQALAGSADSRAVYDQLVKFFPIIIPQASQDAQKDTMKELLDTNAPQLNYPPFPRTWVEIGLVKTQETKTNFGFNLRSLSKAFPLGAVVDTFVQAGVSLDYSIDYRYSKTTTFIAMTSSRRLNPGQKQNSDSPFSYLTFGEPKGQLRSIINWDDKVKKNYFKVENDYPMVGLCKYEMSLQIAKTKKGKVEFIIGSYSDDEEEVQPVSYAVYSNFFQIESNVPIQDYLRVKCQDSFSEAVRFLVETDFNKLIAEYFANYHPLDSCKLSSTTEPAGDASCMEWFNSTTPKAFRFGTVPRCVIGKWGTTQCVLKSKKNGACPLYWSKEGKLTDVNPEKRLYSKATAGDIDFACDEGLTCKSDNSWLDYIGLRSAHCK
ncbi:MAG: hypothetical protein H6623_07205 [Bdellovibrionaceae bacterium]|nr:hypothetical protein [Pseudobdellovibrionaceae bacterium]